ncbi:hypothetical protein [Streptomyces ortus]|uniref:Uncharacterized protein n=1 Tax=Streptomyces ortus TaxID=2867268 RepID=A0ABT3V879_9ACTN|nr:hypothetical protein [Streptomyces ortus]MCX4234855.1 hypothetical protein [Streptomyces ortus]
MRRTPRTAVSSTGSRRRRLRDAAAFALLRGMAYGLGTGAAGLLVYWLQSYL